nr:MULTISPECIES: cation efflux protein, CzcI family [unclassified Cupriavidus]
MLVLPFQFSWAAAARYCQHESAVASWHLGHHDHRHQAAQGDSEKEKAGVADTDCGVCHIVSVPLAFGTFVDSGDARFQDVSIPPHVWPFSSRGPTAPDRPQWLRLV